MKRKDVELSLSREILNDISGEREKQLRESLEVVNKLLGSDRQNTLGDAIRAILRKRADRSPYKI